MFLHEEKMKKLNLLPGLIIFVNLLFFTFCFAQKTDLHVDEVFSFGQANSTTGAYLFPNIDSRLIVQNQPILNQWLEPSLLFDYVTVQKGERFAYQNVIKNLSQGVHPPFFHMMLHTVSSFFPDDFSIWQGYILNLPILTLLLVFIYYLALALFAQDKKMACLFLVFCGFSLFVLNMAIYIRMYLLWMCLSTALVYFSLKLLQQNTFSRKIFYLLFGTAFLCFLTHMYALPFVFFLSASTCLWLVIRKNWRLAFQFGGTILTALVAAYACFPYLLDIMFHSSRGEQFKAIATHLDFNAFAVTLKFERFYDLIFSEVFNFANVKVEYLTFFLILAFAWGYMQHIYKTKMLPYAWWMLSFALPYVGFLSFFSPDMGVYDDRYFSPVLVVFALLIFYWLNYFLKTLFLSKKKRVMTLALLVVLNLCFLHFNQRSIYLLPQSSFTSLQKLVKDKPVLVLDENHFNSFNLFYFLLPTQKFYIFQGRTPPSKVFDEAKGGFLLVSSATSAWYKLDEVDRAYIPNEWKSKFDFLGTYQIGIYFYDVYKIKA